MKIQCDVCSADEASVFCSADEAALCHACDHRVHHANKVAGKHHRFSLLHPSLKDPPRCDVCQERRAFLFCQEDRAILCSDCDLAIHTANEHTEKHNRFLLTGIKLSSCSSISVFSSSTTTITTTSSSNGSDISQLSMKKPISVSSPKPDPPPLMETTTPLSKEETHQGSTSSISEYLMEMLPGWHVEDFLDPSYGFCKSYDPILDSDLESSMNFSPDDLAIWVPKITQAPNFHYVKELKKKENKKLSDDALNRVPQISPPYIKRSRHL